MVSSLFVINIDCAPTPPALPIAAQSYPETLTSSPFMSVCSSNSRLVISPDENRPHWKRQLQHAVSNSHELLRRLGLEHLSARIEHNSPFPLRAPQAYLNKIRFGDASDPLLLQILPQLQENLIGGEQDPVQDLRFMPTPGLLHKYHGRALLITTGACAVHCRYCFRRHYPYADAGVSARQLDKSLAWLQQHPDIDEVILSGGDPLVLDDERLFALIAKLESLPQLRYLRIHTRLPVVLPDRITAAFVDHLAASRFRTTVVIHCNHANEIADDEARALNQLHHAGITLLNQSVLLKGINDDVDTLARLSKKLHDCNVLPYYLHCLDPVQGGMHFEVNETDAVHIMTQLRARLPGYLLPRLVREIPDSDSKTAISVI